MNLFKFVTAPDIRAQLKREARAAATAPLLIERHADWMMRIRCWNVLHQRYRHEAANNNWKLARHLWLVLIETRDVNK